MPATALDLVPVRALNQVTYCPRLYFLEYVEGVSRHYMPVGVLSKGREQTTLVFDTWANVGNGEVTIHWPCDLSDEESTLVRQLAVALGYLGRSESWVEAELTEDSEHLAQDFNAWPDRDGKSPGREFEQVSLM